YHPRTAAQIRAGWQGMSPEYLAALEGRAQLRRELEGIMDVLGVRAWICPAATGPAPEGLDSTGDPAMNLPWTHAGMPAITVPAGRAANGLPVGLQLVGRSGDDDWLVSFAGQVAGELRE